MFEEPTSKNWFWWVDSKYGHFLNGIITLVFSKTLTGKSFHVLDLRKKKERQIERKYEKEKEREREREREREMRERE